MKRVLFSLILLLFTVSSWAVSDYYVSIGFDGYNDMAFRPGVMFKGEVFTPINDGDIINYGSAWISSADIKLNDAGWQFKGEDLIFKRITGDLYVGAGETFHYINLTDFEISQFETSGCFLWYPLAPIRMMFRYSRENNDTISGVKLEITYLGHYMNYPFMVSIWGGFYRWSGEPYRFVAGNYTGYSFGSSIGIKIQ